MIAFTTKEIINSVFLSFAYGAISSFCYTIILTINSLLNNAPTIFERIVVFDNVFPVPHHRKLLDTKKKGPLIVFISILFFGIGFILLSYLALDGEIRLYMLIVSSALFYLLNLTFFDIFRKIVFLIFDCFIVALSIPIRLFIYLLKKLFHLFIKFSNKSIL